MGFCNIKKAIQITTNQSQPLTVKSGGREREKKINNNNNIIITRNNNDTSSSNYSSNNDSIKRVHKKSRLQVVYSPT